MDSTEIIKLVGQGGFLFLAVVAVTRYLAAQIEATQTQLLKQLEDCRAESAAANKLAMEAAEARTEDAKAAALVMIEMTNSFQEAMAANNLSLERNGDALTSAVSEFRRASDEQRR